MLSKLYLVIANILIYPTVYTKVQTKITKTNGK